MSLLEIWILQRQQLEHKHIQQIIGIAGEGRLRDNGEASGEFREFLSNVPSDLLAKYSEECLTSKFDDSGLALQDIVNELGRRLGFKVENGRYRGIQGQSGHDGLWQSSNGLAIIIEVKTTDAFRIDLDTIVDYRKLCIEGEKVLRDRSSILILVGRQDTGGLEAQIRGSRHAWDVRLISVDALLRLVRLKEELEDPEIHRRITNLLIPQEFTRVDGIIDLVFSTAEQARQEEETQEGEKLESSGQLSQRPQFSPVKFHDACAERIQNYLKRPLVRQSRAFYAAPDGSVAMVCVVSREHQSDAGRRSFWFAFHPHQKQKLSDAKIPYIAFGCGSEKTLLLIPFSEFEPWIVGMNTTELDERMYWHVSIFQEDDKLVLHRKQSYERIDLTRYLLKP
jgi:hypothetical protein